MQKEKLMLEVRLSSDEVEKGEKREKIYDERKRDASVTNREPYYITDRIWALINQ